MRLAAVGALRTTCHSTVRGFSRASRPRRAGVLLHLHNRTTSVSTRLGGGVRSLTTSSSLASRQSVSSNTRKQQQQQQHQHVLGEPLRSSMYFRRVSVALVSGLVGYGAWYGYKGDVTDQSFLQPYSTGANLPSSNAAPTRNVLIVSADELHTGTFVGEGPIAKTADGSGGNVLEMLTPDQATEALRENEASFMINRGHGVLRYDVVQLASNNPIEDDHAEKIVEVTMPSADKAEPGSNDWMFWGVFDGHAGWTTSAKLRQTLISFVARELNTTYKAASSLGASPSSEAIDAAIKAGFTRLDHEIVHESVEKVLKSNSKRVAAELLGPALSGSCALLSFYDSNSKTLRVACTGDSRAVLGRRSDSGKWTATALSEDQTGSNPNEEARMRKAHPGEARVVHNGRVLGGLEPTRAFGDASYKWSREVSDRLRSSFFGRSYSPYLKTPPYVTAEPVVTTTKIQPEKGDFVVMATDGLWEMLTNDEVVGLVGKWIETQAMEPSNSQLSSVWSKIFGSSPDLPVVAGKAGGNDGQKTPIRLRQWGISPDEKDRFVVKDKNVATHLIRNALGGKNEEQVCALLTLVSPFSRRYRDDLTVQVIFFGNGQKTDDKAGDVLVNQEATSPPKSAIKAKL
ncbi:phosphatase 2C-like domain-containing protein [Pseudomassariella vexata]|uniref:Phosphatase 2C-like domain-containing protein n=1 Tax=Pseudomassariella vexata TaxID=1141098 RepID=A0A1Y2DYB0_9PEZI|nr:phosphatase 2C-like domain-containing protein [Pseudomassariella vexata]ORY64199.1 phosphatase 2C-like domain-containing protein [Pseudomassariella vexata]